MLSQQLIDDLINPGNTNIIPGLDRMKRILQLLGNPQLKYKVIHITGSNGKGSTAAFLESGLIHAGFKVGKFSSPHIHIINESILINFQQIPDKELELLYLKIKSLLQVENFTLSPFEFLTAIMFEYFTDKQIDWLILEVGMGGLNDSTNVVDSKYSIITNVELEHTKWLGNSIEEIALQKAGIIKNGLTVIADNKPELIAAVGAKTDNYINVLEKYSVEIIPNNTNFTTLLKIDSSREYQLSLFGYFQVYNFLCAYTVLNDIGLSDEHIQYAAANTRWAGRLELISRDPDIILDATHNAAGAKSLFHSLDGLYKPEEMIIITSVLRDKDISAMLNIFAKLTKSVIFTTIDNNPRGMTAMELIALSGGLFEHELYEDNPLKALETASQMSKKAILITGSLYLLSYFY